MAKWGEGDPRWIVEERPDATNVNNWHWSEKNATPWSKDKLKSLFEKLVLQDSIVGKVTFTELSKCNGEATANNRKGKLILFYEWDLQLEWKAEVDEAETDYKGSIEIPNLSEENDASEVDINVIFLPEDKEGERIKEFLRKTGADILREKIAIYIKSLREEYSSNLLLPTKSEGTVKQNKLSVNCEVVDNFKKGSVKKTNNLENFDIGCKKNTAKLEDTITFQCTASDIFKALTVREMVVAFTRGNIKWNAEVGGDFELFGGNISGFFVEIIPNKKIIQKWRSKTWPSGHYSDVTLNISQKDDHTQINFLQTGIPNNELEKTREGWKTYYWDSMKRTFGFGAVLM